ncbi:MarR family winged helix-turn-helix transcriptional regulator [Tomitella cavernea]|nr:MarR family transcriptional regulator [Tomitella cavernea]
MSPDQRSDAHGAMGTEDIPSCTDELGNQLARLHRMRERTMTQVGRFGADGLELAAYRCVFAVLQHGPMRSGELAETMLSDPSTVSRHVAQLVERGHLERQPDRDDRRASLIAVTESGRRAAERMRLRRNQRLGAVVGAWPESERVELARLLGKLLDGYELRRDEIVASDSGAGPRPENGPRR